MPKGATRQGLGTRKKSTADGKDSNKASAKLNRKLPPLLSGAEDTNTMMSQQESGIDENNTQEIKIKMETSEDDSNRNGVDVIKQGIPSATTKHKVTSRRRIGTRQSTSYLNSASSNIQKRPSSKPKTVDGEMNEGLLKPKPRRKTTIKLKYSENKQLTQEIYPDNVEGGNIDGSKLKQQPNPFGKSQWTHIIRKSHIHRHQSQKNKTKPMKKREPPKRKKSDYVIENTWLPRETTDDSTDSQKLPTTKKLKSTNKGKTIKSKENSDVSPSGVSESINVDDIFIADNLALSEEYEKFELAIKVNPNTGNSPNPNINTETDGSPKPEIPARSSANLKAQSRHSSPKQNNNQKLLHTPKLHTRDRETTHVNQINVADFAKLNVQVSKPVDTPPASLNITDYQYRVSKIRFKGASNSVPNYNDKQEAIKKTVAQNDALLKNTRKTKKRKDSHSIQVSRIEPISPGKPFLLPSTMPHRNKFMDLLLGDTKSDQTNISGRTTPESSLPRLKYGSPTPLQRPYNGYEDEMAGEISIIVPKLPHLNAGSRISRQTSANSNYKPSESTTANNKGMDGLAVHIDTSTEDEPKVIVTNENGIDVGKVKESETVRDGWESGYQSITPRLSIDSRSHALITPAAALHLDIPSEHRSITPFSNITLSTYIDHSRPSSTHLDVPHLTGDTPDARKSTLETRSSISKLPAIYSRNDEYESVDERIFDFTPLPIQSIRTSDTELSDDNE